MSGGIGSLIGECYDMFKDFELRSIELEEMTDSKSTFIFTDLKGNKSVITVQIKDEKNNV